MKRTFLILALLFHAAISLQAQFTEIASGTTALTPHWKNLAVPVTPAYLGGHYYLKMDDKTFIKTNGTLGGTAVLPGFMDIPKIADYVATSNYLYYSTYKEGKIFITRFDPIKQVHTPVKNSSKVFAETDETIMVYSVFQHKLIISCWYYNRSASKTFVYVYAIHDNDPSPNAYLLAASVNQDGILDGPVGLSDEQVIAMYNLKTPGMDAKKVVYAFGFNDSLNRGYTVKKNYDFSEIGLQINSVVGINNDVLFVLNNKKKIDANETGATSVWLLRNKSAKKLGDLSGVRKNSLSRTYQSGEWQFLQFDDAVYSFNSRTSLLKQVIGLQPNESLAYITPAHQLQLRGDTLWCRVGTKQADGNTRYQLSWILLSKPETRQLVNGLPQRFNTAYWYEQRSLYYPYINGTKIYFFEEFNGNGAQLFQYSMTNGQTVKLIPPSTSIVAYEGITQVIPVGSSLIIKCNYKTGKETVIKTFLFKM